MAAGAALDGGEGGRRRASEGELGREATREGQLGREAASEGELGRETTSEGRLRRETASDGQLVREAASEGQLGREATRETTDETRQSQQTHAQKHDAQHDAQHDARLHHHRRRSHVNRAATEPRRSLSYSLRRPANAYYDSRAATRSEWKRRARTLDEYYDDHPHLLPQLPFTWHHGWRRWRLFLFALFVFVDASAVPIALYYGLHYAGDVEGWIIFAVVTTIWGGPTYLEFAVRTLRLVRRERFYRPLGTDSRWCFDMLTWASVLTIAVVTALFVVGSAPHAVWLRVLCMPAPAILYCLGGVLAAVTLFHRMGWRAPLRISSTPRGAKVLPGAYYFIEDVVAVNAGAGRPYREALAARYKASPRFRRMLYLQSLFWSLPALLLAVPLTVIAVVPPVPASVAYGVCWAVPFLWSALWAAVTVLWCKRDMARERLEWEASRGRGPGEPPVSEPASASGAALGRDGSADATSVMP